MRERARLDAIVFDAGGTLVRLDFEWMSELLSELGMDVPPIRLRRAEVEGRRRFDASVERNPVGGLPATPATAALESPPLGAAGDTRAYFGGMLAAAGVPIVRITDALERFEARHAACGLWTRPAEGARATLDRIAALGFRTAVVSNSDGRAERHLVDCGVHEGLELVVDSYHVGVEKPGARIFAIALEGLGVEPEHALYVGDIVAVDVRGARAAGMRMVLIDPYRDYAPRGVDHIPHIGALPDWVEERFTPGVAPPRSAERLRVPEGVPH